MRHLIIALFAAAIAACAATGPGAAQNDPSTTGTASQLAYNGLGAVNAPELTVTSPAFLHGGAIPLENSAYGDNRMPGISWSAGPAGTQSYLIILQDPDAPTPSPFLHWIAGDIPAGTTSLPAGMAEAPAGVFQTGVRGQAAYFGPRPPSGLHNYNFQVFALDTMLNLENGASLADVTAAATGHVLAKGVLVGTYAGPQ